MVSTFLASKSLDLGQSSTASPDFLARFARLYGSMLYLSARGSLRYTRRIHGHVGNAYAPVVLTSNVSFPALVNFSTPSLLNIQNLLSVCQEARDIALKQYEFTHPRVWMESIWTPHEGGYFENGSRDRKSLSTTILDVLGSPPVPQIPRSRVFSAGVRFRPSQDTVYLRNGDNGLRAVLGNANPAELVVTNI
jgi:hypothetical protein